MMYAVHFETNSSNVNKGGHEPGSVFGHIKGTITVQVIADSPHEAVANALLLLSGHRLSIGSVAKQTDMAQWAGNQSLRDFEVTIG